MTKKKKVFLHSKIKTSLQSIFFECVLSNLLNGMLDVIIGNDILYRNKHINLISAS
jgi:hypothetical protein